MTPSEALQHIRTLVEASADLKDDTQRKVLVAQKGLGVAPAGGQWGPKVFAEHRPPDFVLDALPAKPCQRHGIIE